MKGASNQAKNQKDFLSVIHRSLLLSDPKFTVLLRFHPSIMTVTSMSANGHKSGLKTDLSQFAVHHSREGPYADNLDVDVLIVGAGFGGTYMLY